MLRSTSTLRIFSRHLILSSSLMAIGLAVASNALAADGKALYTSKACATCHGDNGAKPTIPNYPKVNGQSKEYTITQIKDIKSGKRNNGMAVAMQPFVMALTDDEITAIATFLAEAK